MKVQNTGKYIKYMYKVSKVLWSSLELAIYRSTEKKEVDNILNMTINNLKIFTVLRIRLVLMYRVVSSCKCEL